MGTVYPVFILTDSDGEPIRRWIGYTGGSRSLIRALEVALSDPTTVKERVARLRAQPARKDALFLARYYSTSGENLKAVEYYRQAARLGGNTGYDYSFEIFKEVANAVWKGTMPFDSIFDPANAVLTLASRKVSNVIKMAQLMTRVAREYDKTDRIAKYLQAGIKAAAGSKDKASELSRLDLIADYTLYIEKDTVEAIRKKKAAMGEGWTEERDTFYLFAKWCLERRINLEEAEMYARRTVNLVYPGKYRARVLGTVAEICDARGNLEEAIRVTRLAIEQDPENDLYTQQLERLLSDQNSQP